MFGRIYDPTSVGALATIKLVGFYGAIIGIVLVFQVVRHTRGDEDAGRVELVSSTAVGRLAPLAAALIAATTLSLGIGVVCALVMSAVGAPLAGSIAFGLAWAMAGLVFACTAAVVAQVAREARPAIGLGVALVLVAYVLRAVGDVADAAPGVASWLSPIGWSQQIRPFAGDRLWVALIPLAASALLVMVAVALRRRRDLGAGLLPDRAGPSGSTLGTPEGLAWRLNRGMVAAWAVGVATMGMVVGSLTDSLDSFFTDPAQAEWIKQLGGQETLTDAFLATELSLMSVAISGLGIAIINHLRREEASGRTELALAGPTSRWRWVASATVIALLAVAGLSLLLGLAVGVGAATSTSDWGYVATMVGASATKIPASWVIVGLAVAAYGLAPRLVPAVWGYLLAALIVGEFAELWGLPTWLAALSPFTHSPVMPGGDLEPGALVGLTAVAAALVAAGLVAWRRRDLSG